MLCTQLFLTTTFRDHRLNFTERQLTKILQLPTIYNRRKHTKTDIDLITVKGQYLTCWIDEKRVHTVSRTVTEELQFTPKN